MELEWKSNAYLLTLASAREHHLVRNALVEGRYVVDDLPEVEWIARLGRSEETARVFLADWNDFVPCEYWHRSISN